MATENKQRSPRRTRSEWERLIQEGEASGLSARRFCQQAGLSYASFMTWRAALRKDKTTKGDAPFVEITPFDENARAPATPWAIELSLGNGMVLKINPQR